MPFIRKKKLQAIEKSHKLLQAVEGARSNVILESLLTGTALNSSGSENTYLTYASQTNNIYQKYNGTDSLGNWQTRAVIDTRTGFISGEGLSVICKDKKTSKFFDDFLTYNKLYGSRFINFVKQAEMEGRVLLYIRPKKEGKDEIRIKVYRHLSGYCGGRDYKVVYNDRNDPDDIKTIKIKTKDGGEEDLKETFIYVLTGGDGTNYNEPSTRTGLVLWQIESFDRSMNAMRKNNHLFGKVTPVFSSENPQDVSQFRSLAQSKDWKIGDVVAALKGGLKFEVPDVGAMENLKAEQITCSKSIAATTGIPVHWFGNVDLMSNRATAETLYETINNATVLDRVIWQEKIYDLLIKVQEMAIDKGIYKGTINRDFEVKIPLISFSKMFDHIKALSLAYADDAISIKTYRNHLPGVNPIKEEELIQDELEQGIENGLKNDGGMENDTNQQQTDKEEVNTEKDG
jgi:hypothetical protein